MWLTYLSGSYVSVILVLYVADIFEWERDNILICGWHIVNGLVGISKWSWTWLNNKIYQDRLMCLITLSRNTFLDKILKKFRMGQVRKVVLTCISKRSIELISVQEQWLNDAQMKEMDVLHPVCLCHRFFHIKAELCTRRNVTQVLSKKNMLRYDLWVNHSTKS